MKRPWQTWSLFIVCLVALLAAMAWISAMAIKLDDAETEAQGKAAFEENIRLALWRMETVLAGVIAQETNVPYYEYAAFYSLERAYTRQFNEIDRGEILVPSRLLVSQPSHALIHFQIDTDERITSPQVPEARVKDLAFQGYSDPEALAAFSRRIADLTPSLDRTTLLRAVAEEPSEELEPISSNRLLQNTAIRQTQEAQQELNFQEFQMRSRRKASNVDAQWAQGVEQILDQRDKNIDATPPVSVGAFSALWIKETLLLVRKVTLEAGTLAQGCCLDWQGLQKTLLAEITDLLPDARLVPAREDQGEGDGARTVAALPIRLVPGELAPDPLPGLTVIRISLIIAWVCVLFAAVAVAALLGGALKLSERRGAFVSAVTHELRTPLTTLRMYTEMLASDMVPSEEKRAQYLGTLQTEAERLGHLVENVLAYSRLERNAGESRKESLAVDALLSRMEDRLNRHTEMAGMQLEVDVPEEVRAMAIRIDAGAVEQILFNLVDNACKYGKNDEDPRLLLTARIKGRRLELQVRDHGPGIIGKVRKNLFKPFCKSDREAAVSAPGVGLGLALCRRLAREMAGDLTLDEHIDHGTGFTLSLPMDR